MAGLRISERQNSARGLLLRQAAQGAHRVAQRAVMSAGIVSIAFMLLGIAATVFPRIAAVVAISATAWALIDFFVVETVASRANRAAALIQEELDTWLFEMEWDDSIEPRLPAEDVSSWARRLKTPPEQWRNWYPDVDGIPDPYAVLLCQRVNLLWDVKLRRRYSTALVVGVVVWTGIGIIVGLALDLTVRQIVLSWFVPSVPGFIRALRDARAHREVVSEKAKLFEGLRAKLESPAGQKHTDEDRHVSRNEARRVQSSLYRLRRYTERVPGWLYRRYRDLDQVDSEAAIAELRRRLAESN